MLVYQAPLRFQWTHLKFLRIQPTQMRLFVILLHITIIVLMVQEDSYQPEFHHYSIDIA